MIGLRHFAMFMAVGLIWGTSPSFYRLWGGQGIPVLHVLALGSLCVGLLMLAVERLRTGRNDFSWRVQLFGLGCAVISNVPWGLNVYLARKVPTTELGLAMSTGPIVNYAVALFLGRAEATRRRLLAILLGFASSMTLIATRPGAFEGEISWWLIGAFSLPFMWTGYHVFTATFQPKGADIFTLAAAESNWGAATLFPIVALFPLSAPGAAPALGAYWTILIAAAMWGIERFSYFTLQRETGVTYTGQAAYVSAPASVILGALLFGGGTDFWVWACLGVLMGAIYFNNTGAGARPRHS